MLRHIRKVTRKDQEFLYTQLPNETLERFQLVYDIFLATYKVWKTVQDKKMDRRHIEWGFSNYLFGLSSRKGVKDVTSLGFISRDALLIKAKLNELVNTPTRNGNTQKLRVTQEHVWPRRYACEQLFKDHHQKFLKFNEFCNVLLDKYLAFTWTSSSENDRLSLAWQEREYTDWQDAYKDVGIVLHEVGSFKGLRNKKLRESLVNNNVITDIELSQTV